MPGWKGEKYLWTAEEKMADLLDGLWNEERTEKEAELRDLVDAVRRDWAAEFRSRATAAGDGMTVSGLYEAAGAVDPDKQENGE